MPGFHIEDVLLKYLINHKRGAWGPLGPPLNPPLIALVHASENALFYTNAAVVKTLTAKDL